MRNTILKFILMATLGLLAAACSGNLTKPPNQLEDDLYQLFPRGTTFQEAIGTAKKQGYEKLHINVATGFLKQEGSAAGKEIGKKSIQFALGKYREGFLVSTAVEANLGFDEEGRLIEIWVRKTRNAP